jgi:hypothetical protein
MTCLTVGKGLGRMTYLTVERFGKNDLSDRCKGLGRMTYLTVEKVLERMTYLTIVKV